MRRDAVGANGAQIDLPVLNQMPACVYVVEAGRQRLLGDRSVDLIHK